MAVSTNNVRLKYIFFTFQLLKILGFTITQHGMKCHMFAVEIESWWPVFMVMSLVLQGYLFKASFGSRASK